MKTSLMDRGATMVSLYLCVHDPDNVSNQGVAPGAKALMQ